MHMKPGSTCPSAEAMGRFAAGDLEPVERARILDHAVTCATCGEEIALFRPLRDWASESAGTLERHGRFSRFANTLLPVAAGLFLAIGAALWLRPIEWQSGGLRDVGASGGMSSAWTLDPPAGATLPEPPRALVLRGVGREIATASYEFQLFDHELALVWRSGQLDQPRVELPEEVRAGLRPGETYGWRVIVGDGLENRHSSLAEFSLAP